MVQQTGFEVLGNNEVMTVFSATGGLLCARNSTQGLAWLVGTSRHRLLSCAAGIACMPCLLTPPVQPLPPVTPDYRDSGNTGAVLMIAPSLEFEFVCFPPARLAGSLGEAPAAGASAGPPAEQEQFSSPQPAAPLPDHAGVSLPVGPLAASPFAADADVPLRAAAPAAVAGVEPTPAQQTMQQVRCSRAAAWRPA